ncbi:MAG: zinc ribbon domain-containing protein [Anaerolineales bacterium]|nr:MAG: zinc ribbon domain-containing protein [Anaerolineales bacterium]
MPIYEYRCQNCQRRFSVFWRTFSSAEDAKVVCKRCSSTDIVRLVSRVRVLKSEESRMENLADPGSLGNFDEDDPKSMGRFMRKMMKEMGDETDDLGPEFEEVVDRLEAGQDPESIEKDMPDLLGGADEAGTEMGSDF